MSRVLGTLWQDRSPFPSRGPPRSPMELDRWFEREMKWDNLCALLTQVPRYFGSCHKISVLTTHARIHPTPCWNWKIPGNRRPVERKREKESERKEKPQISPSTARANALLMNPLIALIVLINDSSNEPTNLRALINIAFFWEIISSWMAVAVTQSNPAILFL